MVNYGYFAVQLYTNNKYLLKPLSTRTPRRRPLDFDIHFAAAFAAKRQSWHIRSPDRFVTEIGTGFIGSVVGGDDVGDGKMDFKIATAAAYAG